MKWRLSCKNSRRVNTLLTLFWTSIAICSFFVAMAHKKRVENFKKNSLEKGMYMKDREWLFEQLREQGVELNAEKSPVNKYLKSLDEAGEND